MLDLLNFADLQDFLKLSQEQGFLYTVSKWPVFEESFEKRDSQCSILCKEKHGASEELLIELRACLYFVEWDDDILEEDHVLISQRDGESRDDTGKNIKKLSGTIEFMCFVDKTEEALIDSFPDHFTARYQLN